MGSKSLAQIAENFNAAGYHKKGVVTVHGVA